MTVQYIFRLEDPSFDDSSSLPKQKQQEIWRVKEIKRIVDCSLPQAKAIHDAIAAGEFHKVDGVVLSQLIGDFIIELPGTRTTGPDDVDVRPTNFDSAFDSETMVKSGEQRHCGSGTPEHCQACTDLKWLEAQDSIKPTYG